MLCGRVVVVVVAVVRERRASIRKVIIDFETTIRPYQKVSYHFDQPLETLQPNLKYKKLIIVPVTDNLGTIPVFCVKSYHQL